MIASVVILVAVLLITLAISGAFQKPAFWKFLGALVLGFLVLAVIAAWIIIIVVVVHFVTKYW